MVNFPLDQSPRRLLTNTLVSSWGSSLIWLRTWPPSFPRASWHLWEVLRPLLPAPHPAPSSWEGQEEGPPSPAGPLAWFRSRQVGGYPILSLRGQGQSCFLGGWAPDRLLLQSLWIRVNSRWLTQGLVLPPCREKRTRWPWVLVGVTYQGVWGRNALIACLLALAPGISTFL